VEELRSGRLSRWIRALGSWWRCSIGKAPIRGLWPCFFWCYAPIMFMWEQWDLQSPLRAAVLYIKGSCCWRCFDCFALTSLMILGHFAVSPDQHEARSWRVCIWRHNYRAMRMIELGLSGTIIKKRRSKSTCTSSNRAKLRSGSILNINI